MEYFRSTATTGGLLCSRAPSPLLKETAGDLLRATSAASAAVARGDPTAAMRLKALRELVLACVGGAWARDNADDAALVALRRFDLGLAAGRGATEFDRLCSAVLCARFPSETRRPELRPGRD